MKRDLVLGVPFCRPTPLHPFLTALGRIDLATPGRKICFLFVVDQDAGDFVKELESQVAHLRLPATITVNAQPLGFVGSADRIFEVARAQQSDVILLDPHILLFPGTLAEMIAVAESDPMLGFVGPRCNTGAVGKFPLLPPSQADNASKDETAFATFEALSSRLPRKSYVPTVDGLCLLVKLEMLESFGNFEVVAGAFMEENDLIARANRCGYRAAIANHAFVFHAGPPATEPHGAQAKLGTDTMREIYPHYHTAIGRYGGSPAHRALRLISTLAEKPPLSIAFDFSSFGRRKDGTTEYGTKLVASFARRFKSKYRINVICEPFVWKHHELATMDGLVRSPVDADTLFPAIVRLGQPFDIHSVKLGASRGAVSVVCLLDCIAYDCLHICPPELEALWKFVLQYSSAVMFPSEFSRAGFADRFPGARQGRDVVSMPSTDIDDYASPGTIDAGKYLLVVGNSFAHKAVNETVEVIGRALPGEELKVLGSKLPRRAGLTSYDSGTLSLSFVQDLFANAKAVIFPSHYEGFGFPVMHALGNRKAVFVRDLPVYEEIRGRVSVPGNIHAFGTNEDLVRMLTPQNFRWDDAGCSVGDVGWDRAVGELDSLIGAALGEVTFEQIESRLEQLDLIVDAFAGSQTRVSELEEQIKGFRTSTSWKVTAPLRKLKMLFS